jgi:hypothetical protein
MQSPSDHQMQHQPQIAFGPNRDSLADSAQFTHNPAFRETKLGIYGSQQERTCKADSLDGLTHDAPLKCGNIGCDIR